MPAVEFVLLASGETKKVEAENGRSVMETAQAHNVPGIIGECGGTMSCATCHVYVVDGWADKIPSPDPEETDLLEAVAEPRENSRLSCQIKMNDTLDGLVVQVPASQI
jgi:2Fe-2S ferredoxin